MNLFEFLPEVLLWGSIAYFWIMTSIVTVILLVSEKHESWFWTVFAFLGFLGITQFQTELDLRNTLTLTNTLMYLGIGFIYAILRTYIYGKKSTPSEHTTLSFYDLKEKVIAWWFLWPISIINWVLSDLIGDVTGFIYDRFKMLFEYIFKLGLGKTKEEKEQEVQDEIEKTNDRNNDR